MSPVIQPWHLDSLMQTIAVYNAQKDCVYIFIYFCRATVLKLYIASKKAMQRKIKCRSSGMKSREVNATLNQCNYICYVYPFLVYPLNTYNSSSPKSPLSPLPEYIILIMGFAILSTSLRFVRHSSTPMSLSIQSRVSSIKSKSSFLS